MNEARPTSARSDNALKGPARINAYVKALPDAAGVYRMLDAKGNVLYVGKARSLRKRVAAYAQAGGHSDRISRMIAETAEMLFVTTASETEALLLESNLIKRLRPRYNISFRDDKSFPNILLREDHAFPQLLKHRGAKATKGVYFGPFASVGAVNRTLSALQRAFLLRSCSDSVFESRTRPCLLFQIKRCSAPCVGRIEAPRYRNLVEQAEAFLTGKSRNVQAQLAAEMNEASDVLDFERAARLRDRLHGMSQVLSHQGINPATFADADVFAAHALDGEICIQVFFFRAGQNWGNRPYFAKPDRDISTADVLEAFIGQFYDERRAPSLVVVSEPLADAKLLADALSLRAHRKVEILRPQRGEKREIALMALQNAREQLARKLSENSTQQALLENLAKTFGLDAAPRRIEIYDNSHIQGTNAVGAMVVAGPGGFEKGEYRKFNIKSTDLAPGDDYGMMREVLTRRFSRLIRENEVDDARSKWPDLVLVDGGPGQVSACQSVFEDLGVDNVTLVGVAKGPDRDAGREHFHIKGREAFRLDLKSSVLYFLQRLRDEAHRFAIGGHRKRRGKSLSASPLDEIPGVGATRKRALLQHFGSARAVVGASLNDLRAVGGVSAALAKKIFDFFHPGA